MRRWLLRLTVGVVLLLGLAIGGLLTFIYSGVYDVAATRQHTAPVYWAFLTGLRQSIRTHAAREAPEPPDLADEKLITLGLVLYDRHCLQCHGAPGIAPDAVGLGMTPPPPNLVLPGRERTARELYWTVANGLKMTGMPAWEYRMEEQELWAIVGFLKAMPTLSPAEYRSQRARLVTADEEYAGQRTPEDSEAPRASGGDSERGRVAIRQYGCQTCHLIPGVTGADSLVGPPLNGIASRKYLAGVLTNTPEHMIEWLRNPQWISPLSAMPDLGVTERDARDIAEYLSTLH
jgi:mono/diheme cytochrome c family protein